MKNDDEKILAALKRAKATRVVAWESVLAEGVTLSVKINYPLHVELPNAALAAINMAASECSKAFDQQSVPEREA